MLYTQIFAIVAFATTANFSVDVQVQCATAANSTSVTLSYPFSFSERICTGKADKAVYLSANVSSDAQVIDQLHNFQFSSLLISILR